MTHSRSRSKQNENLLRSNHFGLCTPASIGPPGYTRSVSPVTPSNPVLRGANVGARRKPTRRLLHPGSAPADTPLPLPNETNSGPAAAMGKPSTALPRISALEASNEAEYCQTDPNGRNRLASTAYGRSTASGPEGRDEENKRKTGQIRASAKSSARENESPQCCGLLHDWLRQRGCQTKPNAYKILGINRLWADRRVRSTLQCAEQSGSARWLLRLGSWMVAGVGGDAPNGFGPAGAPVATVSRAFAASPLLHSRGSVSRCVGPPPQQINRSARFTNYRCAASACRCGRALRGSGRAPWRS